MAEDGLRPVPEVLPAAPETSWAQYSPGVSCASGIFTEETSTEAGVRFFLEKEFVERRTFNFSTVVRNFMRRFKRLTVFTCVLK